MRLHEFIKENTVDEMALSQYTTMGDFNKPGPFRGVDKKLVPHPTTKLKTARFLENSPYDFRLFFSNISGTGKHAETGEVSAEQLKSMFGDQAAQIAEGSEDTITVVYVGNSGDAKVMLTPWMMAHRFGHAISASGRRGKGDRWKEAEQYFFKAVNDMLEDCYSKNIKRDSRSEFSYTLEPEYNALFNAIGTQKSSKSNKIKRPYEFLYEIFAQYLGTGKVTLNPLPTNLTYGRQVWGNPTKFLKIKPEYQEESDRASESNSLATTMEYLFDDALSSSVGKIFVM